MALRSGRPLPSRRVVAVLSALVALASSSAACRGGKSGDSDAGSRQVHRYTVRGEIVRVPAPGAPARELLLRHEAIPDFVSASGQVVGMDAMVMPFAVAPDVSLDGIRPGDKIEAVLAVDWSRPSTRIERLQKLPPDTALRFEQARPASDARPQR